MQLESRFDKPKVEPLHKEVVSIIFRSLLNGKVCPGERLKEEDIAEELGVSRSPVRRAFHELSVHGIVDLIPRKGARISRWSIKDVEDFWRFRVDVEGLAAEQAALRIDNSELENMEKLFNDFIISVKNKSLDFANELDIEFHKQIVRASRNNSLISLYENMTLKINMFMIIEKHFYPSKEAYDDTITQHREILDAIISKKNKLARKKMETHIGQHVETLINRMYEQIPKSDEVPNLVKNILSNNLERK